MILWGIALLFNPHILISLYNTYTDKEKNETLIYITFGMFLTFGLIIVWIHNDWYLAPSIIVTLVGWVLILKALFWICLPNLAIKVSKKFYKLISKKWFPYAYGIALVLIGSLVLVTDTLL